MRFRPNDDVQRFAAGKIRPVLGGVFDERLQEQFGHGSFQAIVGDGEIQLHAIAIAPGENIGKNAGVGQLLAERHQVVGIQRVVNELAELEDQIGGGVGIAHGLHAFAMDEVQRVENKMRVDLGLQRPQPHIAHHLHLLLQFL